MADTHVVVIHPHADYERGDLVTKKDEIDALLRDHPTKVTRINAPASKK